MEIKLYSSQTTRKIIQTALFIALAFVIRNLAVMVYFLGAPGMRISFAGVFSRMPAILFGPLYGGAASGILDIVGFLNKPEGGFNPFLTLTAILGGVLAALVWNIVKKTDTKRLRKIMWMITLIMAAIGFSNLIILRIFPDSPIALLLDYFGEKKAYVEIALIAVSVIGLILLTIDYIICKRYPNASFHQFYLKVLPSYGVAGISVNILNTFILRMYDQKLASQFFIVILVPRLISSILVVVITSYISAFLLSIYMRCIRPKEA
ncbi:MAG: folate family ECF transporter S component [Acetivibrionales bacterium]|jgi:ECF transporter S component (folate family)